MDLRKLTDVTDYFVVCSADSDTQVKAIADAVIHGTEQLGMPLWKSEGMTERQWILLDYVDVVVHIFHKEVRKYYNLEKLWGDSVVYPVEDTLRSRHKRSVALSAAKPRLARRVNIAS